MESEPESERGPRLLSTVVSKPKRGRPRKSNAKAKRGKPGRPEKWSKESILWFLNFEAGARKLGKRMGTRALLTSFLRLYYSDAGAALPRHIESSIPTLVNRMSAMRRAQKRIQRVEAVDDISAGLHKAILQSPASRNKKKSNN
jgi:hypothetical protein